MSHGQSNDMQKISLSTGDRSQRIETLAQDRELLLQEVRETDKSWELVQRDLQEDGGNRGLISKIAKMDLKLDSLHIELSQKSAERSILMRQEYASSMGQGDPGCRSHR